MTESENENERKFMRKGICKKRCGAADTQLLQVLETGGRGTSPNAVTGTRKTGFGPTNPAPTKSVFLPKLKRRRGWIAKRKRERK